MENNINKTNLRYNDSEKLFIDSVLEEEKKFIKDMAKARKEKGITQKELSDRIGLRQQTISRIENFKGKPSLTNIVKYLKGIDIDLSDIFK